MSILYISIITPKERPKGYYFLMVNKEEKWSLESKERWEISRLYIENHIPMEIGISYSSFLELYTDCKNSVSKEPGATEIFPLTKFGKKQLSFFIEDVKKQMNENPLSNKLDLEFSFVVFDWMFFIKKSIYSPLEDWIKDEKDANIDIPKDDIPESLNKDRSLVDNDLEFEE